MTKRIGIISLIVELALAVGVLIIVVLHFVSFMVFWWPFTVVISLLFAGATGSLIAWLVKKDSENKEGFSVRESFRFLKTYSLVFCLVLTGIAIGSFFLGKGFVVIPVGSGTEAVGYGLFAHLIGAGTSTLLSSIAAFVWLAKLPFLPYEGRQNLILPALSILLFRGFAEGTFGLLFSLTEIPLALLVSLAVDLLAFGAIALLIYGKSQEYPRVVGQTSFEDSATPLGRKIRNIRVEKGLTQSQLGKLIYLDRSTVAKYELGTLRPTRESLLRISEVLDIDFTSEEWAEAENQENDAKAD